MNAEITIKEVVNIHTLKMVVAVNYGDDDMPYHFPFRTGDMWTIYIDLDNGCIKDWPVGNAIDLYMKVCDQGTYTLFYIDSDGLECIADEIENNYVPGNLIPGAYGDYIDFKIDKNGYITNWLKHPSFEDFNEDFKALNIDID